MHRQLVFIFSTAAFLTCAEQAFAFGCPFPPSSCPNAGPCPNPPPTECIVTTICELQEALCWRQNCGGCDIIRIPFGVTLNASETIGLGSEHSGSPGNPLRIIIEGTIKWTGDPDTSCMGNLMGKVFSFGAGASHIFIEGGQNGGAITSDYIPCQHWTCSTCNDPPNGTPWIGNVFSGHASGGTNITIQNLTITNFSSVFLIDANDDPPVPFMNDLTLKNLTINGLTQYGGFFRRVNNLRIENCHVSNTPAQHGFRFRQANGVTILNSSGTHTGGTGFRMQDGSNLVVDGFVSNGQRIIIGPQPNQGSDTERVLHADVRNVEIVGQATNDRLEVNLGLVGGWFENIESQISPTLGLGEIDIERPMNRIYWRNLNHGATLPLHDCIGLDYGPRACKYDFIADGSVNVNELLAVINAWGPCGSPCLCVQTTNSR